MDQILSEAKAKFVELLDKAEKGQTVMISSLGRPFARFVPEEDVRRSQAAEAIERLKALRDQFGKASLDEVLASRNEGRSC